MEKIRLQKYLAQCGVCSRRKAEELILAGRVAVNGQTAEIGSSVAGGDEVLLDGNPVAVAARRKIWIMLNKPAGYITSAKDQFGRKTVLDLLVGVGERVFPVGRLDFDTTGLLLLTNDGDLAHKLAHPRYNVEKVYEAALSRPLTDEALVNLHKGVMVDGRVTRAAKITNLGQINASGLSVAKICITEGRNRIVRKMFAAVGNKVILLKRVALGGLELANLPEGKFRELSNEEIKLLRNAHF